MRKINSIIKKITVCLFAVICLSSNYAIVANADEVEGSDVAIIEIQDYTVEGGMIEAGKDITVNKCSGINDCPYLFPSDDLKHKAPRTDIKDLLGRWTIP